jgi:hypothetical protein
MKRRDKMEEEILEKEEESVEAREEVSRKEVS